MLFDSERVAAGYGSIGNMVWEGGDEEISEVAWWMVRKEVNDDREAL